MLSMFHLNNNKAGQELKIVIDGSHIRHECHPVYLGVTLNRTVSYKHHLKKMAAKAKSMNLRLSKLTGTTWAQMHVHSGLQPCIVLFGSWILQPTAVNVGIHSQSGCQIERHNTHHHQYNALNPSSLVSRPGEHCPTWPAMDSSQRQSSPQSKRA